jgi:hypothetical protein
VDNHTDYWGAWLRASPDLVDLMKSYRLAETRVGIDIYSKRAD